MYSANSGQDWNVVVLKKKQSDDKQMTHVKTLDVSQQYSKPMNNAHGYKNSVKPIWKVESTIDASLSGESNKAPITFISKDDTHKIVQARVAAKLTQQQLAHRVHLSERDIKDIESGKAVEHQHKRNIANIRRVLNIK